MRFLRTFVAAIAVALTSNLAISASGTAPCSLATDECLRAKCGGGPDPCTTKASCHSAAFVQLLGREGVNSTTSPSQNRRYVPLTVRVDTLRDGVQDDTLARPLQLTADDNRV